MGNIRLLPDIVASQVAAGEVVERPASVVKELVENSLDAGASAIEVSFGKGGAGFIRVVDDGRGMGRDDALMSLERHATSKIRTAEDLSAVRTFGFRGEALPSIASVSKFRLTTRPPGEGAGTRIDVVGGKLESVRDSGEAPGTDIEVRSLFFNVPARRKFLKGENTEAGHIHHGMQSLAMANPGVGFTCLRDGRRLFRVAPGTIEARIRDLCGAEFLAGLVPLGECVSAGLTVRGYVGRAGVGRGDRSQQFVFVNGRAVQSADIQIPLREAYRGALDRGLQPLCVLFLEVDPSRVDCNVHPAKREVRFAESQPVRLAVLEAVRAAISSPVSRPVPGPAARSAELSIPPAVPVFRPPDPAPVQRAAPAVTFRSIEPPLPASPVPAIDGSPLGDFRSIGTLRGGYALLETAEGLVLLACRAARARILFEDLLKRDGAGGDSQRLLLPAVVELPPGDLAWALDHSATLGAAGIAFEPFGAATVKIDAAPPFLAHLDPGAMLRGLIADVRERVRGSRSSAQEEAVARSICRLADLEAVPSGEAGVRALLSDLFRCEMPYTCPEGNPTLIQFSHQELARKFGRRPGD